MYAGGYCTARAQYSIIVISLCCEWIRMDNWPTIYAHITVPLFLWSQFKEKNFIHVKWGPLLL